MSTNTLIGIPRCSLSSLSLTDTCPFIHPRFRVTTAVMKHHGWYQLGKNRESWLPCPEPQPTERTQCKNSNRKRNWRQELRPRLWTVLLTGWLLRALSSSLLTVSRTSPGMPPYTVGQTHSHQSFIRKMLYRVAYNQIFESHVLSRVSFLSDDESLWQDWHKASQHSLNTHTHLAIRYSSEDGYAF